MTDSEKLDLILSEVQGMKSDVQGMKSDVQGLKSDVQGLKSDVQELKERVSNVETKVTNVELTLENEISVNIKRVAEGHLDLSRNLHDALKIDGEKEMMAIRLTSLENELRRLKQRVDSIA